MHYKFAWGVTRTVVAPSFSARHLSALLSGSLVCSFVGLFLSCVCVRNLCVFYLKVKLSRPAADRRHSEAWSRIEAAKIRVPPPKPRAIACMALISMWPSIPASEAQQRRLSLKKYVYVNGSIKEQHRP